VVAEDVPDGDADGDGDPDVFAELEADGELEAEADADAEVESVVDGDADADVDGDAEAEVWSDVDGDAEADVDGDGDPSADAEADGEEVLFGLLLALTEGRADGESLAAGDLLPEGLAELVGDADRVGDGDDEGEGEDDGEGEELADAGRTWHAVPVAAVVPSGAACAVPSMPRERKLPLSKVTAAALTCAKRIRIACLCCSSGLPCAVRGSEWRADRIARSTHFLLPGYICITCLTDHRCARRIAARPHRPGPTTPFLRVTGYVTVRGAGSVP